MIPAARRLFYRLSAEAIQAGLLTPAERDTLSRQGTRKAGYWARHLRDLREVLAGRVRAMCASDDPADRVRLLELAFGPPDGAHGERTDTRAAFAERVRGKQGRNKQRSGHGKTEVQREIARR